MNSIVQNLNYLAFATTGSGCSLRSLLCFDLIVFVKYNSLGSAINMPFFCFAGSQMQDYDSVTSQVRRLV